MNENKNIQLNSASNFLILLDKLSDGLFGLENLNEKKLSENHYSYREDRGIETNFFLSSPSQLNIFDFGVLCAAISEFAAGNEVFTIRRLWRKIGGGYNLPSEMNQLISDSVEKLALTRFSADLTNVNQKFKYSDVDEIVIKKYLLPVNAIETKINGQVSDSVFRIIDTPPLLEIAELKSQLVSYDSSLLDVPHLRNTLQTIIMKIYLFYRVISIVGSHKQHKKHFCGKDKDGKLKFKTANKLDGKILFSTLFEKCGLSDATKRQQQQARETITKILNHFQSKKLIKNWRFEKANGAFRAIEINFKTPKNELTQKT